QRFDLGNLPANPVLVKSIVTGDLSRAIASHYGIETVETLTGFKNICGKANEYDVTKQKNYLFGYEESIGFCYGTFVRDKDAVSASMMIVEMAAYYKK
ncbi:TPA: phospho-sugar mutase, partial [Streptococcus pyogenes]|nr:phospho-sugar mutase [Streptococcus pyogenes]